MPIDNNDSEIILNPIIDKSIPPIKALDLYNMYQIIRKSEYIIIP